MPLKIVLYGEVVSDIWMGKEDWEEDYKNDRAALIELLYEDPLQIIEDAGGLEKLVRSAEWIEK